MMKKWLAIIIFLATISCQQSETEKTPLAQVGENYLYLEDVAEVLPGNLDETDSTLWVDDFVKKWVRSELVVLNAEQNLSPEQKDVQEELDEYRNSLLTYRYKQELVRQKLDTVIYNSEIEDYFYDHPENYILHSNIIKAVFLKIPLDVASPETIKDLCETSDEDDLTLLDEYAFQYAKQYDRFNDNWINANQVFSQMPEEFNVNELFLTRNKIVESSDTNYYYFICIRDYRIAGSSAPIDYVSSDIKNILINERKLNFLKTIEDDIYNEGVASNKFKIFNIKK